MVSERINIPIIVWADVETGPLGLRSRLLDDLAGKPVLRRTIERIVRTHKSGRKIVFCRPEQAERVKAVLTGLDVEVLPVQFKLPGWWAGMQSARKWALNCWRGGLIGACAFDEDLLPHVVANLGKQCAAPAVMTVNAHAPWVDPEILDRQIDQYLENHENLRLNFTQAPPGLSGFILDTDLMEKLPASTRIAGPIIGYHPDRPQVDLISKACNLPIDPEIIQTAVRFTCDTGRGLDLGRRLAETLNPDDAGILEVAREARARINDLDDAFPQELELELVTGRPWKTGLRPRPDAPRGPINPDIIIRRVEELARDRDDLLVTIGGFGEPTRHPKFAELIRGLKQAGAFGIGVQTAGLFEPEIAEVLVQLPIDIISLLIDVPQPDLYRTRMGSDGYETVLNNANRLMKRIQTRAQAVPLIVPVMIKTQETLELMEEFFDGWIRRVGWAVIEGFSDYAAQITDRAVHSMTGTNRKACRQIATRLTVLADGRAVICNQDINGRVPAGSIHDRSLQDLWRGSLHDLRAAHRAEYYSTNPLCAACRQWHRP